MIHKTESILDIDEEDALVLMENNCRAAFYHNIKQDDPELQHSFCPKGRESWCSYEQDKYLSLEKQTDARKNKKRLDSVSTSGSFLFEISVSLFLRFSWIYCSK